MNKLPLWIGRVVLALATLLLARIALGAIVDPVGSVAPHAITLGSAEAITNTRVSGAVFLAVAITLVAALVSERRVLGGLAVLATFAATVLAVRLVGLVLDGPAPFTLFVLKPEVVLVVASSFALFFEWRRRRVDVGLPPVAGAR